MYFSIFDAIRAESQGGLTHENISSICQCGVSMLLMNQKVHTFPFTVYMTIIIIGHFRQFPRLSSLWFLTLHFTDDISAGDQSTSCLIIK